MAEEKGITEQDAQEMVRYFQSKSSGIHSFLKNIVSAKDTTKTGNLKEDELGLPKLPVRTLKELQLFAQDIAGEGEWSEYFRQMSEIQTSTSLSKDALLARLAVTQKKELADTSPEKKTTKKNKGWFSKGQNKQENERR